jgi:antitoxin component of MazEF toxin-antitoxin module
VRHGDRNHQLNLVLHFGIGQKFTGQTMHTSTLRAAGGSIAVTIPQSLAKTTGLQAGDKVSFEADAGRLIISPVHRRKYSLHELLAMQGDEPLVIDQDWDHMPAAGKEVLL